MPNILRAAKRRLRRFSALRQTKVERKWWKKKDPLFSGEEHPNINVTEFRTEHLVNTDASENIYEEASFVVRKMRYGYPILIRETAELMKGIAGKFFGATGEKLVITNMSRTKEHIQELKKDGYPVAEDSSHLYGEAFDIKPPKNKKALLSLLKDLAQKGLINFANEGICFHVCRNPNTSMGLIRTEFPLKEKDKTKGFKIA